MWLSFYMDVSVNHDSAIRRFCPERMEHEQGGEWQDQEVVLNEIELCSSDATSTPCLASSEVDDFVDSFINMDQYEYDNVDQESQEKHQNFDHFVVNDEDEADAYSVVNDIFGYVPTTTMVDVELEIYENVTMPISDEEEVEMSGSYGAAIPEFVPCVEETSLGMDQGLHLVHMLLACAESVGCRDTQQTELLLSSIWALASPSGDSLQRVSYCFATGLKCRLSLHPHNVIANGSLKSTPTMDVPLITRENKLEAFHLLYQTTPYIAFGFMAANEAICQGSQGKGYIHIIDLGMEHTLQWPSLIRALASRPEGPPKLRITGLMNNEDNPKLQTSMNLLVEEASSLGIPLEFHIISEPATPPLLTKEKLNLREGEALFVNSILLLHKYVKESRGYLKAILQSIKKLGPIAVTVIEQDTNHNGPFFLGRFLESLHYYSAIFDSLEASMPRNSQQRMKIERLHFAEEILNIVAYEGPDRMERHERVDQWRRQLARAGFQVMPLKCTSQARMMLSVYDCDGYTLSNEKGILLLGWKGRPVMMASAWQVASV
ncbi:GRAS family protein RAD1-like [Gastrolobium bilobum]|uniref:GRAS family protein RAD1-like n=1 Tax=Gastrolobium bilobum TaxID=150636 RepID=UPI002AB22763|nr:GRAS family protein RAD1-like [Gastrolobium bilobum]